MIYSRPRCGYFVSHPKETFTLSPSEELQHSNMNFKEIKIIQPDQELCRLLRLTPENLVILITRVNSLAGETAGVEYKYMPYEKGSPSIEEEINYAVFPDPAIEKSYSFNYYTEVEVQAATARGEVLSLLRCEEHEPLLQISRLFITQDDQYIAYSKQYLRASCGAYPDMYIKMEKIERTDPMKLIKYLILILLPVLSLSACQRQTDDSFISKTSYHLNTVVTIQIYDSEDESLIDHCFELCEQYENLFSRTLESSEIYRLNHGEITEVSQETADLIQAGLAYGEQSGGAFDITIAPVTSLWDFSSGNTNPALPDPKALAEAVEKVDYTKVSVSGRQVTFQEEGMAIDLGAIAKGYIADRLKDYLLSEGVNSAIINLGGNILCIGNKPSGEPFNIAVQKPFSDQGEAALYLEIDDLSVVSSGTYERYITVDGKQYHHLLDSSTGYPCENGLTSVTIISPQSVDGDGLSTSCFCLGLEDGMKLIESMPDCYGIFITSDGEIHLSEGLEDHITVSY